MLSPDVLTLFQSMLGQVRLHGDQDDLETAAALVAKARREVAAALPPSPPEGA